ncbi:hypothetical protein BGZ57DRAFT_894170 [Hyaloscypha finlandica]|nr:hypothetical protein BGZ57DRAFT_894170 [Hyaloscypha finlandica]
MSQKLFLSPDFCYSELPAHCLPRTVLSTFEALRFPIASLLTFILISCLIHFLAEMILSSPSPCLFLTAFLSSSAHSVAVFFLSSLNPPIFVLQFSLLSIVLDSSPSLHRLMIINSSSTSLLRASLSSSAVLRLNALFLLYL